jgi:hypothetical protein
MLTDHNEEVLSVLERNAALNRESISHGEDHETRLMQSNSKPLHDLDKRGLSGHAFAMQSGTAAHPRLHVLLAFACVSPHQRRCMSALSGSSPKSAAQHAAA